MPEQDTYRITGLAGREAVEEHDAERQGGGAERHGVEEQQHEHVLVVVADAVVDPGKTDKTSRVAQMVAKEVSRKRRILSTQWPVSYWIVKSESV